MAKSFHYRIRKTHRYLGLILGIQFLFWTVGGIYFSWSNMDEIHGDLNRKPSALISTNSSFISPSAVIEKMKALAKKWQAIFPVGWEQAMAKKQTVITGKN